MIQIHNPNKLLNDTLVSLSWHRKYSLVKKNYSNYKKKFSFERVNPYILGKQVLKACFAKEI